MPCGATRPSTWLKGRCSPAITATGLLRAASARLNAPMRIVTSPSDIRPHSRSSTTPSGAPRAMAPYVLTPLYEITRAVFSGPALVMPHSVEPVDPRLSPTPRISRLRIRLQKLSQWMA